MQSTVANQDYLSDYQPMCPYCGRLGYGYHEGTTGHRAHYFVSPKPRNEPDPKWREAIKGKND